MLEVKKNLRVLFRAYVLEVKKNLCVIFRAYVLEVKRTYVFYSEPESSVHERMINYFGVLYVCRIESSVH